MQYNTMELTPRFLSSNPFVLELLLEDIILQQDFVKGITAIGP